MHRRLVSALVVFAVAGLSACGGGSSSGGGSQGGPAPTAFAGRYEGHYTQTLNFGGQSARDTRPIVIVVRSDGRVGLDTGATTASCIGEAAGTPFLAGNRIVISRTATCFEPSIGTCDVVFEGEIVFSATNAVGSGTEQFVCPGVGTVNGNWGIGANKVL